MPTTPRRLDLASTSGNTAPSSNYFAYPVRYAVTSALRRMAVNPSASRSQPQSRSSSRSRDISSSDPSSSWRNAPSMASRTQYSEDHSYPSQAPNTQSSSYQNIMDMDNYEDDDMGDFVSGEQDFDNQTPGYGRQNGSYLRPPQTQHDSSTSLPLSYAASYSPSPRRTPPPFTPPPLSPLSLDTSSLSESSQILSRLLAEEIRLLLPPRLQLVDTWNVLFSLERDGSSLSTLFERCEEGRGRRGGYVCVVRDGLRSIFGAYLSDPPGPSKGHYYGTGECFLWRSTIVSASPLPSLSSIAGLNLNLPPPPSADTTHATRMTTVGSPTSTAATANGSLHPSTASGTSTPDERIRFKAFPYSGVNDYMIFCEHGFLSVGGGDGHYGLWLDSSLERGISSGCPTFGNEPLSEEGDKFDVLGVEVWYVGV